LFSLRLLFLFPFSSLLFFVVVAISPIPLGARASSLVFQVPSCVRRDRSSAQSARRAQQSARGSVRSDARRHGMMQRRTASSVCTKAPGQGPTVAETRNVERGTWNVERGTWNDDGGSTVGPTRTVLRFLFRGQSPLFVCRRRTTQPNEITSYKTTKMDTKGGAGVPGRLPLLALSTSLFILTHRYIRYSRQRSYICIELAHLD
jgi:hypothetical protein